VPGWGQPVNVTGWPPAPQSGQLGTLIACPRCQQTNPPGARFCSGCGSAL